MIEFSGLFGGNITIERYIKNRVEISRHENRSSNHADAILETAAGWSKMWSYLNSNHIRQLI